MVEAGKCEFGLERGGMWRMLVVLQVEVEVEGEVYARDHEEVELRDACGSLRSVELAGKARYDELDRF